MTAAQLEPQTTGPRTPEEAVSQVVLRYHESVREGDLKSAYELVSAGDRAAKPFAQYEAAAGDSLQHAVNQATTHSVTDVKINGETATAFVDSTGPNVAKIQQAVFGKFVKAGEGLPDSEGLRAAVLEVLAEPDLPMVTMQRQIFLTRQDDVWRLDFDWDGEHPNRAIPLAKEPPKPEKSRKPVGKPDVEPAPDQPINDQPINDQPVNDER